VSKASKIAQKYNLRDISLECALCGIAVNEVEGFVAENLTEQEIITTIQTNICDSMSGPAQVACNSLVADIPEIITRIENLESVDVICVETGYCDKPFNHHSDPGYIPQYTINMDLPPVQRWTAICSNSTYQQIAQYLVNTAKSLLPNGGRILTEIGRALNDYYYPSTYAAELRGCADVIGVDYGWLALFQIGYEVSDACTSIVAQTKDGKIYHARNLDFWDGMGFTDSLKDMAIQIAWQKGGKTMFSTTSFAGYIGVLSGFKNKAFSATVDTRFYPDGLWEMFYEIIAAIEEKNASLVGFLSREVFENENDFESALENLSDDTLIADVYYIVAGVSSGQGAVISRNRLNATDVWRLNSPTRWYEVETNYDHWENPPWFDNRVVPANNAMNAMGQQSLSLDGMFKVLSVKPVFNLQTTYTILSCPADGTYKSFTRYCPYPCVE
jgi:acid ceramidase